jgi:hypothetical protein
MGEVVVAYEIEVSWLLGEEKDGEIEKLLGYTTSGLGRLDLELA